MTANCAFLADTHCHLNAPEYDSDRDQVLANAISAGIQWLIVPGIDLDGSRSAVKLAEKHPDIYAAVGIHPHAASSWNHAAEIELRKLAQSPRVVAIGEIGLDFYRNLSPHEIQIEAFQAQLAIAADLGLPVIVHNRESINTVIRNLLDFSASLSPELQSRAGVLHAFSADLDSALKAIEAGFYIGIAGPITFRNAELRREITRQLPLERLLTETDAPYLSPHPHRGKRNEPARVRLIAEALAKEFNIDYCIIANITRQNASILFGIDDETNNS